MTLQHQLRNVGAHRMVLKRADPDVNPDDPPALPTPTPPTGGSDTSKPTPSPSSDTSKPVSSPTTSLPTTSPTSISTTSTSVSTSVITTPTSVSTTSVSTSSTTSASTSTTRTANLVPTTSRTTPTPTTGTRTGTGDSGSSSFRTVTGSVTLDAAGHTVSANSVPSNTSATSTGSIVGAVVGAIAGILFLGFLILCFLRKWKRAQRRKARMAARNHNSDFGTFNRSVEKPAAADMSEKGHNVAPSVSSAAGAGMAGFGSAVAAATVPATKNENNAPISTAPAVPLQERPKYIYGQEPVSSKTGGATDDDATHGAYSTEPQMQASYNAEAYGNYAHAAYQDAEREYQGQTGYAHGGYDQQYDQQQYAQGQYDQQAYAHGGYDNQQQYAYPQNDQYYGYATSGQEQIAGGSNYQQPHPYSTTSMAGKNADAYGGM